MKRDLTQTNLREQDVMTVTWWLSTTPRRCIAR
jgi:hypothetical protein